MSETPTIELGPVEEYSKPAESASSVNIRRRRGQEVSGTALAAGSSGNTGGYRYSAHPFGERLLSSRVAATLVACERDEREKKDQKDERRRESFSGSVPAPWYLGFTS
jgi:hypothetical protein